MKKFLFSFLVIIILLIATWVFQPFKISSHWYFLLPAGLAEKQLYEFELPNQAKSMSDVTVIEPDGAMPEIASRSFTIPHTNVEKIKAHFLEQCKRFGLATITDALSEPDMICLNNKQGAYITAHLSQKCLETQCKYFFEVRAL